MFAHDANVSQTKVGKVDTQKCGGKVNFNEIEIFCIVTQVRILILQPYQ